ncbi:MAG: MFS transporter [Ignavibacteriales bacterium]
MSIQTSLQRIKAGFLPSFWVANVMELFERIAYYGQATILSIFLRNHLKFNEIDTGRLSSIFGGLIYFLPIFAGALADKFGFKKAFSFAFLVLALGYFMIGATGMAAFSGLFDSANLFWILIVILIFTAIGGSFIKPSVLGTVALTSSPETKSIGYAIYYWLVNIGGALGPLFAYLVRDHIGIQYVYVVSSACCALMLISTILFYKEPTGEAAGKVSIIQVIKNLTLVVKNAKFMIFLLIFSLYWLMFWQIYIIIPFYVTDYIAKDAPFELISSVGAWGIILFQLLVNFLTKKLAPINAIVIGFSVSTVCWLLIMLNPSIPLIIAGLVIFSMGEMTQAPRYYEYIADLAPKGQAALFQGYAFLPIAIGWFFGGNLGGWLYKIFATDTNQPKMIFLVLFGIGVLATVLMLIYNLVIKKIAKTAA